MEKSIKINGIMCSHCEMRVKKALEALPFIEKAEVSHESGQADVTVQGAWDEAAVKSAVTDAGYEFVQVL